MPKIAVVGSGFIGRAWAITFARGGCDVALYDREAGAPAAAIDFIAEILPSLEEYDLLGEASRDQLLTRIRPEKALENAVADVVHVQENAPEKIEVKRDLYVELDRLTPDEAVLASSTSSLLPSAFSADVAGRHRCLVAHPINPPYLVPAVELVPSPHTAPEAMERTAELMRRIGQSPIVMKNEIDGFVMNRLQGALLQEAFRLVDDGYASPEDVDIGIREGLALRWAFMGPFETIDLNAPGGVRDYVERYQFMYDRIAPSQREPADWSGPVIDRVEADRRKRLPADQLGVRQTWRDRRLMALAAHKRDARSKIGD